jgi:hypothetical protein
MDIPKELIRNIDPKVSAIYMEMYADCIFTVFNNGLKVILPYPLDKNGNVDESVFIYSDVRYRRN